MRNSDPNAIDYNTLGDKQIHDIYISARDSISYRENGENFTELTGTIVASALSTAKQIRDGFMKSGPSGAWKGAVKGGAEGKAAVLIQQFSNSIKLKSLYQIADDSDFYLNHRKLNPGLIAPLDGLYVNFDGNPFNDVEEQDYDFWGNPIYTTVADILPDRLNRCFDASADILMYNGLVAKIPTISVGDSILAFDPFSDLGRSTLVPKKVIHTFTNITEEWLRLTWSEKGEQKKLVTTPNHQFLTAYGDFREIESLVAGGKGRVVLADGSEAEVTAERIVYSAATADMFEQAEGYVYPENGNLALNPVYKKGWKTYNFEVEEFHTYVAGGVRVHNDSWDNNTGFEYKNWQNRDGNATVELADGSHVSLNGEDVLEYRLDMSDGYINTPDAHAEALAYAMAKSDNFNGSDISYASWREHTQHRSVDGKLPEPVSDAKTFSRVEASIRHARNEAQKDLNNAASNANRDSGRDNEGARADTSRSQKSSDRGIGRGDYNNDGVVDAREFRRAEANGEFNNKSNSNGGGNSGKNPILIDLDGDGLNVMAFDRSTIFMDTGGDGFLHRTAWAGEGDGILYFDPDGRSGITEKRQFIFTEWDPTATSDLEALASVFDTNGDSVLDAGDTDFAKFKVMVTLADGSTVSKTLAELGITEIDLTADASRIELSDGHRALAA
jgi:hypothetical protein